MTDRERAEKIVRSHIIWSLGAGLVPIPLFDITAVTAIQIDMLNQLATLYDVDFSSAMGKTFVSALTGSTLAKLGASLIKALPGIGPLLGGISMSAMSGASTYAVGQVMINHLETGGDFLNVDLSWAKSTYDEAFKAGQQIVSDLKDKHDAAEDVYQALEKLGKLKEEGIITDAEFEAQKQKLLERL